jgi:hypothetical protein
MRKVLTISTFALLLVSVLFSPAFAADIDPRYGLIDTTGTIAPIEVTEINSLLKVIYDQDGLSVFLLNAEGVQGSRNDYIMGFLNQYVFPYPEKWDKGVAVLWDDAGGYGAVPFSKDQSMSKVYTGDYLNAVIKAALDSSTGKFGLYESLALELRARAADFKRGETEVLMSGGKLPQKLEAPNYMKATVGVNDAGQRYLAVNFELPPSVQEINDYADVIVSFSIDFKIDDDAWATEKQGALSAGFSPGRVNARQFGLLSNFYEGGKPANIDVENRVFSFRGYFDFVTPDGKVIRSPFTDEIRLTAKK